MNVWYLLGTLSPGSRFDTAGAAGIETWMITNMETNDNDQVLCVRLTTGEARWFRSNFRVENPYTA